MLPVFNISLIGRVDACGLTGPSEFFKLKSGDILILEMFNEKHLCFVVLLVRAVFSAQHFLMQ